MKENYFISNTVQISIRYKIFIKFLLDFVFALQELYYNAFVTIITLVMRVTIFVLSLAVPSISLVHNLMRVQCLAAAIAVTVV
jgi:hypothetical protein